MTTELNEIELQQQTELDPEYEAYVEHEVTEFAKKLSQLYVDLERWDARMASMLFVLRRSPNFAEKLLRDFKHEAWLGGSLGVVEDIKNSALLTKTLLGTMAGFVDLATEIASSPSQEVATIPSN